LESYRKIKDEYDATDPSDEKYDEICKNLEEVMETVLKMAIEDKKLRWDRIKFGIGTGFGVLQMGVACMITLIGLDWESANSMRSRFTPKMIDTIIPKAWQMPRDNR
jgi:hypothetical protein